MPVTSLFTLNTSLSLGCLAVHSLSFQEKKNNNKNIHKKYARMLKRLYMFIYMR